MRILVLDVGGTHVKALVLSGPDADGPIGDPEAQGTPASRTTAPPAAAAASGQFQVAGDTKADPTNGPTAVPTPARIDSGPTLTPAEMVTGVQAATANWTYDAVSIGYPGPVVDGRPAVEPHNLGAGWVGFDFAGAFGRPVRVINDAAMQALGGYRGGRMLFLGLGTGLGSALVISGHLQPLELAHLPYKRGRTFEQYVGEEARERDGSHRWRRHVIDTVARLHAAMQVDSVLLGGGNARRLEKVLGKLPAFTRVGSNADALRGGVRLWVGPSERADVELSMGAEAAAAR